MATAVSVSDPRVQAALRVDDEGRLLVAVKGGGGGNVDLSNYYTKAQTDQKITEAVQAGGGSGSVPDLSEYVKKTDLEQEIKDSTIGQVTANQGHAIRHALGLPSSQTGLEALENVPTAAVQGRGTINGSPLVVTPSVSANPQTYDLVTKSWVENAIAQGGNSRQATAQVVSAFGSGLVVNGSGSLGDNFNFSKFEFDGTDTYSGFGSFKITGRNSDVSLDSSIPVSLSSEYELAVAVKSDSPSAPYYVYIQSLDIDGNIIYPDQVPLGTFRVESVNGNSLTVHPDDRQKLYTLVGNWSGTTNCRLYTAQYASASGFTYPEGTYSRTPRSNNWAPASVTYDQTTGVLSPIPGLSASAGETVAIGRSGGTYAYPIRNARGQNAPTEWQGVSQRFRMRDVVRGPTALVRLGILANRGSTTSTTWISSLQLREVEDSGIRRQWRLPANLLPTALAGVSVTCEAFGQHLRYTLVTGTTAVSTPATPQTAQHPIPVQYRGIGNGNVTLPLPGGSLLVTDTNGRFVLYGSGNPLPANLTVSSLIVPGNWREAGDPTNWTVL